MGENIEFGPINQSDEWGEAIYACLKGIKNTLEQSEVPTQDAAETVRLLAEAVAKLTFG